MLRYNSSQEISLIVNVYAPQNEHDKLFVWNQIGTMANQWSGPTCILGDFNSICKEEERFREIVDPIEMLNFNNFILSANLIDQPISNEDFTWEGLGDKMSRIDRVMVNVAWIQSFPDAILQAGDPRTSDHKPIIWGKKLQDWGPKPFRFYNSWLDHIGFVDKCNQIWYSLFQEGWAAFVLAQKFRSLKIEIRKWKVQQSNLAHLDMKQCESEIKQLKGIYKVRDLNLTEIGQLVVCNKRKRQLTLKDEAKKKGCILELNGYDLGTRTRSSFILFLGSNNSQASFMEWKLMVSASNQAQGVFVGNVL